jgi:urease accessory protein
VLRAISVLPAGEWIETRLTTDTVVLDYDQRHRRRVALTGKRGLAFLLDLPHAIAIRDRDGLVLEDGRIVLVSAAGEALAEIGATDPIVLARVAWHLGNRHLAAQLLPGKIRIRRDHVIEAMVGGLGASVTAIEAAFDPEIGAYASHGHPAPTANSADDHGALEHDDRIEDDGAHHG